jgi:hypothetical protein
VVGKHFDLEARKLEDKLLNEKLQINSENKNDTEIILVFFSFLIF